jgi:hypothetical protein
MPPISHNSYISINVRENGSGNQSRMITPEAMATLDKQHTGRRQTPKNKKMSNTVGEPISSQRVSSSVSYIYVSLV